VFLDPNGNATLDAGEQIVQTFAIANNVVVMRSANGANMTANRWGQLAGINAVGFAISPRGNATLAASTMVCVNSGGRVRIVERSVVCP
jgi:type IV fimbrial biogenesis protein FimT